MTTPPSGTVTFLLTDIESSTALWERDPATMRDALAWHDSVVREAIERHDGYVFTTAGDSFAAAFADPIRSDPIRSDSRSGGCRRDTRDDEFSGVGQHRRAQGADGARCRHRRGARRRLFRPPGQ